MIQADFEDLHQVCIEARGSDEVFDPAVHVIPILEDLLERGPREELPLRSWIFLPDTVVVRVEQETEVGMKGLKVHFEAFQKESLVKPSGVSQMPFDGACLRHRLDTAVLSRQRLR